MNRIRTSALAIASTVWMAACNQGTPANPTQPTGPATTPIPGSTTSSGNGAGGEIKLAPQVEADLNRILGQIGEICRVSDLCVPDVDPIVNFPPTVPPVGLEKVFSALRQLNESNLKNKPAPKG